MIAALSGQRRVSQSHLACGLGRGEIPKPLSSPPAAQVAFAFLAGLQPTDARVTAAFVDTSGPWDCAKTPSGAAKTALRRDKALGCQAPSGEWLKAYPAVDGWVRPPLGESHQ